MAGIVGKRLKIGLIIICSLLFAAAIYVTIKTYMAEVHAYKAKALMTQGQMQQAQEHANRAIHLNPYEPAYYKERARIYISTTLIKSADEGIRLKNLAFEDVQKAYELNKKNLATIRNTLPIYYYLSLKNFASPEQEDNIDEKYLDAAIDFFRNAKVTYSTDAGLLVDIAKHEKILDQKGYKDTLEMIWMLRPDLLEWHPELIQD